MGRNNKDFNWETDPTRKERERRIEEDPYSVYNRDLAADHSHTQIINLQKSF